MLLNILVVILIVIAGMWGGQRDKWVRRYLVPLLAVMSKSLDKKESKKKALLFLPLIGLLSMGYGVNSWLRKVCGDNDTLTRIAYGLLLGLPFLLMGKWYALIALPIAFSIKAGGFKIGTKDWLWEDFFRYLTLGVLVIL
jgi:hypothetical protein